jgi:hypothetical protein
MRLTLFLGPQEVTMSRLSLRWTLLTTFGLTAGVVVALLLGGPIEAIVGMLLVTPALTVVVGVVLGALQAVALRRRFALAGRWIAATSLGLGAGLAAGVTLVEQVAGYFAGEQVGLLTLGLGGQLVSMAVVGAVAGGCLGAAQWLLLRRRAPLRRWPLVCACGLALGFPAGTLLAAALPAGLASPAGVLLLIATAGFSLGAFTARPLAAAA